MESSSPYKTLATRIAWACPWYRVRQDDILTPDGRTGVYNVVEKEDAVWIVPVTASGQVVLIRNYRYTVNDWCWEVPAGSLEPDHLNIEDTARKELLEEVGGIADEMRYLGHFYVANGIFNETGHIYLATDVRLGPTAREPTEVMEIHERSIPEALHMARTGAINDGPSALAIMRCEASLGRLSAEATR